MEQSLKTDVLIIGAGVAGLSAALLLAKSSTLKITVLDSNSLDLTTSAALSQDRKRRVYALTPHSKMLFQALQVWPTIEATRFAAYQFMQVWENESGTELSFDYRTCEVPALGYIVEEALLRAALIEQTKAFSQITLCGNQTLKTIEEHSPGFHRCSLFSGQAWDAKLIIGADGAQSGVREQMQLKMQIHSYAQDAVIAEVKTEKPHQATARQVFLTGASPYKGSLAFLPLHDPLHCSIVWSTKPEAAQALLALDEERFKQVLGQAFEGRLGQIQDVSERRSFALVERHARAYVKAGIALVGDAAHTLHPLAGQGANLGLADAEALAAVILDALKKGRAYESFSNLRRYERARKGANALMLASVGALKTVFASDNTCLEFLRSQGLKRVNQWPSLKKYLAHYAMGSV